MKHPLPYPRPLAAATGATEMTHPTNISDEAIEAKAREFATIISFCSSGELGWNMTAERRLTIARHIARHILTERQPKPGDVEAVQQLLWDASCAWAKSGGAGRWTKPVALAVIAAYGAPTAGSLRLGAGLTEGQEAWTSREKLLVADIYSEASHAIYNMPRALTAEGYEGWQIVVERLESMARALRATPKSPTEIGMARARESAAQTGLVWTEETRRAIESGIAAALGVENG